MTSLSKHKRFCEGMLRNPTRFSFPSPPEKSSPTHMSPTSPAGISALASAYMANIYGPRHPFPFYPPLGAPGFPVFPAGHPIPMTPPIMPDAKFPAGGSVTQKLPSNESALTPEAKRDGSECTDSSEVSSTSDLDTTGSDVDSEHGSMKRRDKSHTPDSFKRTSTPVKQEPPAPEPDADKELSVKDDPPSPVTRKSPEPPAVVRNTTSAPKELPFDLSKANNNASIPCAKTATDDPLDLSLKSKEDDTPRKTHIFGDKKKTEKVERNERKVPTPEAPKVHVTKEVIRPEIPSPPKEREPSRPIFPMREHPAVHSAFPLPSALMMDPMYRVNKEKLQSFHDTRMHHSLPMAFGSPRIPMHSQNFHPMLQMHPSFMPPPPPPRDPTKLPAHLLGKSPDGPFPHPHQFPHPNKLKERYACKFCGKIFPRSANLTRHLRTHTGEYTAFVFLCRQRHTLLLCYLSQNCPNCKSRE